MTCENCLYKVGCDKFSTGIENHVYRGFLDMETRCEDFRNKADYKEVVRGEWVNLGEGDYRCSKCADIFTIDIYMHPIEDCKMYFCPNCGADMRGENK